VRVAGCCLKNTINHHGKVCKFACYYHKKEQYLVPSTWYWHCTYDCYCFSHCHSKHKAHHVFKLWYIFICECYTNFINIMLSKYYQVEECAALTKLIFKYPFQQIQQYANIVIQTIGIAASKC